MSRPKKTTQALLRIRHDDQMHMIRHQAIGPDSDAGGNLRFDDQIEVGEVVGILDNIIRDEQARVRYHYAIIDFAAQYVSGDLCPSDELMDAAREVAAKIGVKSSAALKLAKQAINKGMQTSLQDGLDYEYEMYALALSLEDKEEGVNAFLEKRKPKFVGR